MTTHINDAKGSSGSSIPPPPKVATKAIGRRPRMSRFLYILLLVTGLAHIAPTFGIVEFARRAGSSQPWLWSIPFLACGLSLFLGRARSGVTDKHRSPWIVNLLDLPYYVHWTATLFALVPSLFATIFGLIFGYSIASAFMWIYFVGLVICAYGIFVRRRFFVIRAIEVPITGLDAAFDGYRIAQLSDLHIGAMTPLAWGMRWAHAANRLAPDLTVVTGDMVTNGVDFHHDIAQIIGELRAKDGVFVSMGNHDYFGEGEPLATLIKECGARVLRNEGLVIERDNGKMYLAAIDDTWTRRDDIDLALAERPEGMRSVLLAHDPERFRDAAKRDVDLVLSGHTHGGQIALPFFAEHVTLSKLTHHYHLGIYKKGGATLYVNPGLGTTGPPIRFGVAPAIALITLRAV